MNTAIRLLLVEDQPGDARLTMLSLSRMPPPTPNVLQVSTVAQAVTTLASDDFDIILTDLGLPDSEGLDTCKSICAAARGMPVVVLTGSHDDNLGLEAIQVGAQDYLVKGEFHVTELRRTLHHAKERQRLTVALTEAKQATDAAMTRLTALEEMRERLVHMIVHDLRSPIFGLRLYLESFLSEARSVPAELRDDIEKAYHLGGRLIEMVSSILDIHRMESGKMPLAKSRCDLRQIAQEAIDQIAGRTSRSPVVNSVAASTVMCDASLIRRAIGNLVGNALKFSPAGRPVTIASREQGRFVEVTVADEGTGVPAEAQAAIFEKFGSLDAQAKAFSTGLGLPFCKMAIELHGGDIGVRSESGPGSIFWFTIPVSGAEDWVGAPREQDRGPA